MKKANKIILFIFIVVIIVSIIVGSILVTNKLDIEKVEQDKAEKLTTSGEEFIGTKDHLAQMQASDTELANIQTELNNFKSKIASAITSKGIATEPIATADTMANNIKSISTGKMVVDLGAETSFNLTSYEGYQNFTVDNFIVVTNIKVGTSGTLLNGLTGASLNISTGVLSPQKDYDSSTGVLTISNLSKKISKNPVGTTGGGIVTTSVTLTVTNVYLIV